MSTIASVFGAEGEELVDLARKIELAMGRVDYDFMPADQWEKTYRRDARQGVQIYWRELLLRCHWVSLGSIIRHRRWVEGLVAGARERNLLAFAACFRGLIESVA